MGTLVPLSYTSDTVGETKSGTEECKHYTLPRFWQPEHTCSKKANIVPSGLHSKYPYNETSTIDEACPHTIPGSFFVFPFPPTGKPTSATVFIHLKPRLTFV